MDEKSLAKPHSLNDSWDVTLGLRYTDMEQMIDDGRGLQRIGLVTEVYVGLAGDR